VVHPAQFPVQSPAAGVTYGSLFQDAQAAVARAREHAVGPFQTAPAAADTVSDYERFLAVTGRHLLLLLAPTPTTSTRDGALPRRVAGDLSALRLDRRGSNAWARAGDTLGLAHDLLATHLGPRGEPRSPEAIILASAELQRAAVDRVLRLVRGPLADASPLIRRARAAQPVTNPALDPDDANRVRTAASKAVKLLAPLTAVVTDDRLLERLDRLPPVHSKLDDTTPPSVLQSISTLHLLRQLTLRQSEGEAVANAHSLQELCRLGVATCRAAESILPYAATPLARVDRAASIDHVRRAGALWQELGGRLCPRIQGLSRAPGIYHVAIATLTEEATTSAVTTRAVLACLPRLAAQSATTVTNLHRRSELVARHRAMGDLTPRWRPLTPGEAGDLAEGFTAAGRATHRASNAIRRTFEPSPRRMTAPVVMPRVFRGLEAER
jgi:hypothetical protein